MPPHRTIPSPEEPGFLSKSLFITWGGLFCLLMFIIYPIINFLIDRQSFSNYFIEFNKLIKLLRS
jgi:hypothetical protein